MVHLEAVTVETLRDALDRVDGRKATLRLVVAINYKEGVSQSEIATWYGLSRKTIYNWLQRFDAEPLSAALRDEQPPGRPRHLDREQLRRLEAVLQGSPRDVGYEAQAWTPELVGEFVRDRFGVDYSLSSVRRRMHDCGLDYVRPDAGETDGADDAGRSGVWTSAPTGSRS